MMLRTSKSKKEGMSFSTPAIRVFVCERVGARAQRVRVCECARVRVVPAKV